MAIFSTTLVAVNNLKRMALALLLAVIFAAAGVGQAQALTGDIISITASPTTYSGAGQSITFTYVLDTSGRQGIGAELTQSNLFIIPALSRFALTCPTTPAFGAPITCTAVYVTKVTDLSNLQEAASGGIIAQTFVNGVPGQNFQGGNSNGIPTSSNVVTYVAPGPSAPVVTTNPVNQTVAAGGSASFTAAASGNATPTVQWQNSSNGGGTFADIPGATSTTYSFTAAAGDNNNQYRAVFTNTLGTATTTAATLTVNQIPQVISFTPPGAQTYSLGGTVTLFATSGASGNPVTFASTDTAVCTTGGTNGATVTFVTAGLCPITASQAGGGSYAAAADVQSSFEIGKADQSISFTTTPPAIRQVGGTYSIAATAVPSGLPVSLSVSGISTAVCSLSGGTVSFIGAGECSIRATQAGDINYNNAGAEQSFTIDLVPTTTTLQISPTSVVLGQSVVLTATVTPAVSSGTVSFSDGATVLCAAVTPVAGVATCTTSFTTAGTHSLTAAFSGTLTEASSTSAPVAIQPVDQKVTDGKAVGSFVSDRANLIVSNMYDMGRQIDRLQQAAQNDGEENGSGNFAATDKTDLGAFMHTSRLGGPSSAALSAATHGANIGPTAVGGQDMLALKSFLYTYIKTAGESGNPAAFNYSGPLDMQADFGNGQGSASFKTSLSQLANWQQHQDKAELNGLGLGQNMAGTVFSPLDIWVEGTYANYSGERSGKFGMLSMGADYVFNSSLLAGVYGQFDTMKQTSGKQISGTGWMAGPYVTARLSDNLFWQARGGWGTSDNTINTVDKFDSTRWLLSSSLSGRWMLDEALAFSPTASFTYFEDHSDAYLDSFSTTIPSTKTSLGQLKLSPELSYGFETGDGLWIEPSLATELIWNFASTRVDGLGQLDGTATGPKGLRGNVKAGLTFKTQSGIAFGASASYDGIGADGFSSYAGKATLSVPLQ